MAKFSIIPKDAKVREVAELPLRGQTGTVYLNTTTGRAYKYSGTRYEDGGLYTGTPRYNGSYLKPAFIEFPEIASPEPIEFSVGDWLWYPRTGMRYRIYDVPQPKKQAYTNSYGGAYIYSSVQLFADTKQLELAPFRDLVPADNYIHFTTLNSWSVYATVETLLQRLQKVMDDFGADSSNPMPTKWVFRLADTTGNPELEQLLKNDFQDFVVSGESVLGALDKIYNQWRDVGWVHDVVGDTNYITVGYPTRTTTESYLYGKGNGLTAIKKSQTNRDELKTRLYVYGSTRNMVTRWYNHPGIKDYESIYVPNLMIPEAMWGLTGGLKDASLAYVEKNVDLYGLRPDCVYFDGSSDLPEIYPSIEGMTIRDVRSKGGSSGYPDYYPVGYNWSDSHRIDEVYQGVGLIDNGILNSGGNYYSEFYRVNTDGMEPQEAPMDSDFENLYVVPQVVLQETSQYEDIYIALQHPVTGYFINDGFEVSNLKLHVAIGDKEAYSVALEVKAGVRSPEGVEVPVWEFEVPEVPRIRARKEDSRMLNITVSGTLRGIKAPEGLPEDSIPLGVYLFMDNGYIEVGITKDLARTFEIAIPQIGFDIMQQARLSGDGYPRIAIKDGMCGGRIFSVKGATYDAARDRWVLTCFRGLDESLNTYFPNSDFPIVSGDHYVLLDIAMPELYVSAAEDRLYEAALKLLDELSRIKPYYEPEIDAKVMALEKRYIREGMYMALEDEDIVDGVKDAVIIDSLVINEGESNIPTYRVTLREEKKVSYSNTTSVDDYDLMSLSDGNGTPGSGRGVSDYNDLDNIPTIDGHEVKGAQNSYGWYGLMGAEFFEKVNIGTEEEPVWAIHFKYSAYTDGTFASGGLPKGEGGNVDIELGDLSDVTLGTLRNGDLLVWNGGEGRWENSHGAYYRIADGVTIDDDFLSATMIAVNALGGLDVDVIAVSAALIPEDESVVLGDRSHLWGAVYTDRLYLDSGHYLSVDADGKYNGNIPLGGGDMSDYYTIAEINQLFYDKNDIKDILANYLDLTETSLQEMSGDLRLGGGTTYGRTLFFGDDDYAYISEDSEDALTIHGANGVNVTVNPNEVFTYNGEEVATRNWVDDEIEAALESDMLKEIIAGYGYMTQQEADDRYYIRKAGTQIEDDGVHTSRLTIGGIVLSVEGGMLKIDGSAFTTGTLASAGKATEEGGGGGVDEDKVREIVERYLADPMHRYLTDNEIDAYIRGFGYQNETQVRDIVSGAISTALRPYWTKDAMIEYLDDNYLTAEDSDDRYYIRMDGTTITEDGVSTGRLTIGGIVLEVVDGNLRINGNAYTTGSLASGGVVTTEE